MISINAWQQEFDYAWESVAGKLTWLRDEEVADYTSPLFTIEVHAGR